MKNLAQKIIGLESKNLRHFDCKLVSTSYDLNPQLKKNREYSVAQTKYA